MAYVPPCMKVKSENNTFMVGNTSEEPKSVKKDEIPDLNAKELFPTLGNTEINNPNESTMNFVSSLFTPQPKEEIVKAVKNGWIHIYKENGVIEHKFGDNTENYIELMEWIEEENEIKRYNVLNKILDRHLEYQEIDLMQNGPEYLECWEISEYITEKERERKRLQREAMGSSDESSEEEYFEN